MATEKLIIELDAKTDKATAEIKETRTEIDKLSGAAGAADEKIKGLGGQTTYTNKQFRNMGHTAQQLGFQIQDVAVQVQSGTSLFTVLGQQGSHIASIFGPQGAVIGALIAVGSAIAGSLVLSLIQGNDAIDKFKDKLEKATQAQVAFLNATSESTKVDALKVQLDKLGASIDDQTAKATKAREAISIYKDSISSGGLDLDGIVDANEAIDIQEKVIKKAEERIKALNESMAALSDAVLPEMTDGITEANDVAEAWVSTLKMQSEAIGKSRSEIIAQTAATMALDDEQRSFVDALVAQLKAEEELRAAKIASFEEEKNQRNIDKEEEDLQSEIDKLKTFVMTRSEILDQQLADDLERLAEASELIGLSDENLYARRLEITQDYADKKAALENKKTKNVIDNSEEEARRAKQNELEKLNTQEGAIRAGMALNSALFEDNKAIAAGLIVADTATAIMRSLSINPYDYANVAILAATGVAQLANALSSSKGGGSASGSSSQSSQPQQQNFQPESTNLDVRSNFQGQSTSTQKVAIDVDGSEDFLEGLAGKLAMKLRSA